MKILKQIYNIGIKIKIQILWQLGNFLIKNPKPADLAKLAKEGQIKQVLISELNFIGDKLLITPAIRALKKQYPQMIISVLCRDKISQSILANNPNIDHFYLAPGYFRLLVFSLKNRGKFDLLIDFSANLYYAFLLNYAKIPYRIGTKPKQKILFKNRIGFGWVYTHTKDFTANQYVADYFLGLLEFLGIKKQDNRLEIHLQTKDLQKADSLLKKHNLKKNGFLIIHPGVTDMGKTWNMANWQELIKKLVPEYKLVFTGSDNDNSLVSKICQGFEPNQILNLAGQLTIRETASLISLCHAFIGVDTGPLHIAVALNKPIIAIFNTTHPNNYLPQRNNIIILNTPEKCKQHFTFDYIKTKRKYKLTECSLLIKPEQIIKALEKLFK